MKSGDFVRINYVGRVNGEIFDLTDQKLAEKEKILNPRVRYGAMPVIIGAGFVIPGMDEALLGMKVGEKKAIHIKPDKAFGDRKAEMVRTVPLSAFRKQKLEPKPGMIVDFSGMKGRIQAVTAGRVRLDFNNPLAGKELDYDLEIVEKIEGAEKQAEAIMEFFNVPGRLELSGKGEERNADIILEMERGLPHPQLRVRIADMILQHIPGIGAVRFVESFDKKLLEKVKKSGKKPVKGEEA